MAISVWRCSSWFEVKKIEVFTSERTFSMTKQNSSQSHYTFSNLITSFCTWATHDNIWRYKAIAHIDVIPHHCLDGREIRFWGIWSLAIELHVLHNAACKAEHTMKQKQLASLGFSSLLATCHFLVKRIFSLQSSQNLYENLQVNLVIRRSNTWS